MARSGEEDLFGESSATSESEKEGMPDDTALDDLASGPMEGKEGDEASEPHSPLVVASALV